MTPKLKRWSILLTWALGIWFFIFVFSPFIQSFFPAWQRFNEISEEKGLDPGALYYTNVPVTQESEAHTRQAIREAMEERRRAREAE